MASALLLATLTGCYGGLLSAGAGGAGNASGASGNESGGADPGGDADGGVDEGNGNGETENGDDGTSEGDDDGVRNPLIDKDNTAIGLRRLSKFEYENTIRDLLGVEGAGADLIPAPQVGFFTNNVHTQKIGQADLETYVRIAEEVSVAALPQLTLPNGCTLDTFDANCMATFLPEFLLHAFRRPATDVELQRYRTLYDSLVTTQQPEQALAGVLQAIVIAPSFLYRVELGDEAGQLEPFELASRMSYFVWGSKPDASLLQAASNGVLAHVNGITTQLDRMLVEERAHAGLLHVVQEWFALDQVELARKGADVMEGLPEGIQTDLEQETWQFLVAVLFAPGASFFSLYDADFTFMNDGVAKLYGVPEAYGPNFQRVELDPSKRRGLFTQPLLIAAHSKESGYSVVQMGKFIRERVLCQPIPPPPPGVNTTIPEGPSTVGLTYREKLDLHVTDPACAACHALMDPPGYAYLTYDAVGRYRAKDPDGRAFDTTGTLTSIDDQNVSFSDATSMLDIIANSRMAKACFVRKYMEYAHGRTLAHEDVLLYKQLVLAVEDNGGDFRAFVRRLVEAPEFRLRGPLE